MKKILLSIIALTIILGLKAQVVTDSVMMNTSKTSDVFYNMKTGFVDSTSNTNWHFAFAVRPSLFPNNTLQSTTIRINEARGVNVFKSTFTNSQWKSFDSAGFSAWTSLHDNDSSWDLGALNTGANPGAFNYGWGSYDMTSHDVLPTNIYLIKIKTGTTYNFRKFMIQRLVYDSQWIFTFANIDGTDSNTVKITKSAYANKLFAYYNFNNKTQFNREPNANTWDMVFTYFNTPVLLGPPPAVQYNVAGVLCNPMSPSYRISHVNKNTVSPLISSFNTQANNISWDWATPPMGPPPADYAITDSMAFFVRCQTDTRPYRIVFTKFTVNDPGKFVFVKQWFPAVGIAETQSAKNEFTVYPNPATSSITISANTLTPATVHIFDLTGRTILSKQISNTTESTIDLSSMNKGLYIISIESEGTKVSKKLIIE